MKKNLLSLLLVLGVLFTSCKKESPAVDPRDKFVGNYQGTFIYQYSGDTPNSSTETHSISKSSSNSNQIIIDGRSKC